LDQYARPSSACATSTRVLRLAVETARANGIEQYLSRLFAELPQLAAPITSNLSSLGTSCSHPPTLDRTCRPSLEVGTDLLTGLDKRFEVRPLAPLVQIANPHTGLAADGVVRRDGDASLLDFTDKTLIETVQDFLR
jgi:hypothetical protein